MMKTYFDSKTHQSGISLIEAMVSLLVLSFGLLAIASFQAKLVSGSGENRARSEAMQLAQQKLDEFRNYTNQEQLVASLKAQTTAPVSGETFPGYAFGDLADYPTVEDLLGANVVVACDPADPAAFKTVDDSNDADATIDGSQINGNNVVYTRSWRYCAEWTEVAGTATGLDEPAEFDQLLYVVVDVSWTDLDGSTQTISLDSNITRKNVTATAELGDVPAEPLIASATGRAYLGDGSVTQAQLDGGTDNKDGTTTVLKANDGADVALVDSDTKEIVLTLVDACKSQDGSCFGFVKISGRVYFDTSSGLTPSTVYVLASDAAYCARVNSSSPVSVPDVDGSGSSDYKYFDYTCYLGGGWYGNIGLLFTAGANAKFDRACVGDPRASFTDGKEKWMRPEVAKRRVYRGAVYVLEKDGASYSLWRTKDGTSPISDPYDDTVSTAEPLYYTKGIGDSVLQPDYDLETGLPVWSARDGGHDFVVYNSNSNTVDYTNCAVPLLRPDSRTWTDIDEDGVVGKVDEPYTDDNGNGQYDAGEPYDDTNGDGERDVDERGIVGSLFARTPSDFVCLNDEDPANDPRKYPYLDTFNGDSAVIDPDSTVFGAPSECPYDPSRPPSSVHIVSGTVFGATNDLAGTLMNTSDGANDCAIDASGTSLNYGCRVYEWGDGWKGVINLDPAAGVECLITMHDYKDTPVTGNLPGQNFTCHDLAETVIDGRITALGQDLDGTTVTAYPDDGDPLTEEKPVICDVKQESGPGDYSFICPIYELTKDSGWSGNVVLTVPASSEITCTPSTKSFTATTGETWDITCEGPLVEHTFTGKVGGDFGVDLSGASYSIVSTKVDDPATCFADSYDAGTNILDYHCVVGERTGSWSGELTINPGNGIACTPNPVMVNGVVDDSTTADPVWCVVDLSGPVTVEGVLTRLDTVTIIYLPTISATDGTTTVTGTCTAAYNDATNTTADYSCTVGTLDGASTWDVTVTYITDKVVCTGSGTGVAPLPVTYTAVTLAGADGLVYSNQDKFYAKNIVGCTSW